MKRSRHPFSSHHSSLKATTGLSCPMQVSLLLCGMGSLPFICTSMSASTPTQLESRARVSTWTLQGPCVLSHTGCLALEVPSPVQEPRHVHHLLTHHPWWGDAIPGPGTVLPKGPESSGSLGGQDDTPGHIHQGLILLSKQQ